jgi:RNA polymerase subunit RPABC4/transcription elongation factor Spt4
MKFCFNCNRITPGDPFFCNFCGRSYDVKLCPRRHANPRTAEACSQCGSRDLSTPQPRRPGWTSLLGVAISVVPGAFLGLASIAVLMAAVIGILQRPDMIVALALLTIPFGILWWMWSQIPAWFRTQIYKLLKRRRERHGGGGE